MALQLMKIAVTADIDVEVTPEVTRFFYVTTTTTGSGDTLAIDAADFFDDNGAAATELPALASNNSYYNVYVNGVLQMEGISTYTPGITAVGSLEILVPTIGAPIHNNVPVVLEVVNFAPSSNITIET